MVIFRFAAAAILALCCASPLTLRADEAAYDFKPVGDKIGLTRGAYGAPSPNGYYLGSPDACGFVVAYFGWDRAGCAPMEVIVFEPSAEIDTLIVDRPNADGYVTLDDWERSDRDDQIDAIWEGLVASLAAQGERLGVTITAKEWLLYPTLDPSRNVLYYAYAMDWDGEPTINLRLSIFDRSGYVAIAAVPFAAAPEREDLLAIVADVTRSYQSGPEQRYADFKPGDHVAEAGAVGVLATLVGVKYGKELGAGVLAVAIAFAKKFWFLLLAPVALFGRLFRKRD